MDDKADDEEQNGETFSYIYNFALRVCLEGTYILQCLYIHRKYIIIVFICSRGHYPGNIARAHMCTFVFVSR